MTLTWPELASRWLAMSPFSRRFTGMERKIASIGHGTKPHHARTCGLLLMRPPPHAYFLVSAAFHYLGPAFAVLLWMNWITSPVTCPGRYRNAASP